MMPARDPQSMLIVGREHEQAVLSGFLSEALAGRGSLVLLSGPAGIGKTTLVRWRGSAAAGQGFVLVTGSCFHIGTPPLYGPWRELAGITTRRDDVPPASQVL